MNESGFTIGDLKKHILDLPEHAKLSFDGGLTFYRLKKCSEEEYHLEFNEVKTDFKTETNGSKSQVTFLFE